mgnify:CR=1 FL=1
MSSMDLPFFKCYASNELAITMELNNEELGIYFRLMNKYWCERETGLDKNTITRFIKTDLDNVNVKYVLNKFFILKEDHYHHKGLLEQIETYKINSERQRNRIEVSSKSPLGNLKVSSRKALSSSSSSSSYSFSSNNNKKPHPIGFELFWKDIKNKIGVGQARKSFNKLSDEWKNKPLILQDLYNQHCDKNAKYSKHPATWLNAECYLDQVVETEETITEKDQKELDRQDWEFAKRMGRWLPAYSSERINRCEKQFGKINS